MNMMMLRQQQQPNGGGKKIRNMIKVDTIINKLLIHNGILLEAEEILYLCTEVIELLKIEPVLLQLQAPLTIVGDIHGQFNDLLRIFKKEGLPSHTNYLFLGDYVDRGTNSIDCIALLFAYKIRHPYNIFLLRGNHESIDVNEVYSFKEECIAKYGEHGGQAIWRMINTVFQWLPLTALIDHRILCVHGGLSPHLHTLTDLEFINREQLFMVPDQGLVCDLLWSDPNTDNCHSEWAESDRGCSFLFGNSIINNLCRKFNIDFIVRGHQVMDEGYSLYCNNRLITVFSASNYCGDTGNAGAVLKLHKNHTYTFDVFNTCDAKQSIDIRTMARAKSPIPSSLSSLSIPSSSSSSNTRRAQSASIKSRPQPQSQRAVSQPRNQPRNSPRPRQQALPFFF